MRLDNREFYQYARTRRCCDFKDENGRSHGGRRNNQCGEPVNDRVGAAHYLKPNDRAVAPGSKMMLETVSKVKVMMHLRRGSLISNASIRFV